MANIQMKEFNGSGYTSLYPQSTLSGTASPTTSTAGMVGQLYINTTTGEIYKCTVASTTYTWVQVGNMLKSVYDPAGGNAQVAFESEITGSSESLAANWLTVSFRKSANVKCARCSAAPTANMVSGTEYNVGTLSTAFRPVNSVSAYIIVRYSGGSPTFALLSISTAGAVTFTPYSAITTSQGINFNFAYI